MTAGKQIQMVMRDMLFITWAVPPQIVRKLVDERLEIDTRPNSTGLEVAFISAVCFRVCEVRTSLLLLPRLSFEQVNYRAYVRAGDVPAVCFLDMKVNSRTVTALTSFLKVPVHYEDIGITTAPGAAGLLRYDVRSAGLCAEAIVDEKHPPASEEGKLAPDFITQRLIGYAGAGDGMFRIEVEQPGLETMLASVQNVKAPRLEQLGLLTPDQSAQPYSSLYVRESLFGANAPTRVG